jgi:hypothetical protein
MTTTSNAIPSSLSDLSVGNSLSCFQVTRGHAPESRIKAAFSFETKAVKLFRLTLLALLVSDIAQIPVVAQAAAQTVPLPRPRPAAANEDSALSLAERLARDPDLARIPEPDPPGVPSDCQVRMTDRIIAVFPSLPAITRGARGCGASDVVRLEGILLSDNTRIAMSPPATMRCTMAEAIAHWVRDDVAPAFAKAGPPIRALDNYASYDCRGRNNVATARTSEHGYANALDVRGVRLADGKFVQFTDRVVNREIREELRKDACARFMTVLGPGSDGHHEEHIHLDLAERVRNYKLCQWNVLDPVPEVPLPRPRPQEAPKADTPAE